jgi:hypothetical protein
MTLGKATAVAIALVAALGLGIWIGPHVTSAVKSGPSAAASTGVVKGNGLPKERQSTARETTASNKPSGAKAVNLKTPDAVPASAENVQAHVKPLLNRGANLQMASEGFRDAEQFVTIAHAARNTEIPFILLKHRVLTEKKSLATAIRESKPGLDSSIEANRARAEARSDMAKLRTPTS